MFKIFFCFFSLLIISCQVNFDNGKPINSPSATIETEKTNTSKTHQKLLPEINSYEEQDFEKPIFAKELWWLNDQSLQVTRAWNISTGFSIKENRPIRVAVIDSGFAGLITAMNGGDLNGQVLWQEGRKITFQPHTPRLDTLWNHELLELEEQEVVQHLDHPPYSILINVLKSHGTKSISSIVSRMNDGKGSVGVAPHAQAIPYKVGNGTHHNWEEVTQALTRISELPPSKRIDVINMSLWDGRPIEFMRGWTPAHQAYKWYPKMKAIVEKLTKQGSIIVSSAGNGSWNVDHNFPAGLRDQTGQALFPEIISVGAITKDKKRAIFKKSPNLRQHGSNWGDNIDIWAPGKDMLATGAGQLIFFDVRLNKKRLHKSGKLVEWGGTSAASPLVAGIVALMKAIRPDIRTPEVKQLLKSNAVNKQYEDQQLRKNPTPAQIDLESECGTLKETLHCGEIFSAKVNLQLANAHKTLLSMNKGAETLLQHWSGRLLRNGMFESSQKETFQLKFGTSDNLSSFHALTFQSTPPKFEPMKGLTQSQSNISIDGWRIPMTNQINVLQIKTMQ